MAKRERKAPTGTVTPGEAKRNDWETPELLVEAIHGYAPIVLDPATAQNNPTRARKFCSPAPRHKHNLRAKNGGEWIATDGLGLDWTQAARGGLVYTNPPYGRAAGGVEWLRKIEAEAAKGCEIIALLGCTRFEQGTLTGMLCRANALCFLRGRLAFRNPDTGDEVAGYCFASMLIGFNVERWRFRRAFEPFASGPGLRKKGERSLCFGIEPL